MKQIRATYRHAADEWTGAWYDVQNVMDSPKGTIDLTDPDLYRIEVRDTPYVPEVGDKVFVGQSHTRSPYTVVALNLPMMADYAVLVRHTLGKTDPDVRVVPTRNLRTADD